jgi:hypothetical protein
MKKFSALFMVSVLLFGASMANAVIIWSENFEGFNDGDNFTVVDPDWSETGNSLNPYTLIVDNGSTKYANFGHTSENGWGRRTNIERDLTGEAAVTGNTLPILEFGFDLTCSGVSNANRHALYIQVLDNAANTVASFQYDWPDVIKFNGPTVDSGVIGPTDWTAHTLTLDTSTQTAVAWVDGNPLDNASAQAFMNPMAAGGLGIIKYQLIYYDTGGFVRSASCSLDNMYIDATPEPATLFLLLAGAGGMFLRRRRR